VGMWWIDAEQVPLTDCPSAIARNRGTLRMGLPRPKPVRDG